MKNAYTEQDQQPGDKKLYKGFAFLRCVLVNKVKAPPKQERENDKKLVLNQKFKGCFDKSIPFAETHQAPGSSMQEILDGMDQEDTQEGKATQYVNNLHAFAQILQQYIFISKNRSACKIFQMVRFRLRNHSRNFVPNRPKAKLHPVEWPKSAAKRPHRSPALSPGLAIKPVPE